jgi:hypothetical protein
MKKMKHGKRTFANLAMVFMVFTFLFYFGFLFKSAPVNRLGELNGVKYVDIFVQGDYAYCLAEGGGLDIIDIGDPTQPGKIGRCDTRGSAYSLHKDGDYVYVANGSSGFLIIDVSDPSEPALRGSYKTSGAITGVLVSGNYAYVWGKNSARDGQDYNCLFQIIDISNPSFPTLVANDLTCGGISDVYVSGNYAYVVGKSGLEIFDITNPSFPALCGYNEASSN